MAKRLLLRIGSKFHRAKDTYFDVASLQCTLFRYLSQVTKDAAKEKIGSEVGPSVDRETRIEEQLSAHGSELGKDRSSSSNDEVGMWKWKSELAWLSKALEPALKLQKWVSITGSVQSQNGLSSRSFSDILNMLQQNKVNIKDWSLTDLTVGLFLIYLSQSSAEKVEDFQGTQIVSNIMVQELIYHLELAYGCYKGNAAGLARHSMLRERNIVKYVKESSVMRPGYYIGVDPRHKTVIFGIRGTHTIYDLITDLISLSDQNVSSESFATHFGTAEAARWYFNHELETIRNCLKKYKGFKLQIVGHSLGGASAALLAIMLRNKPTEELGFSPDIVSAVGFGTPPCVSEDIAESCSGYVSTIVLQDDVVPRLSAASVARLRREILETDWISVLEKEDWKRAVEIVTNAKLLVASIQDTAQKIANYAKFSSSSDASGNSSEVASVISADVNSEAGKVDRYIAPEELHLPGMLFYLQRETLDSSESYSLWRGYPGEHFKRIMLTRDMISDHKCENVWYALRDVLKSLPITDD